MNSKSYTTRQLTLLVLLRFLIGWHLFYEGMHKLLTPGWSSLSFLRESQWILSWFADWVISNEGILQVVDLLNTWGLISIGAGLILGFFTRAAAISGGVLLILYYLNNPPLIGLESSIPSEGNNLVINKTLIESVSLFVLAAFPTAQIFGLDRYLCKMEKNKK